MKKNEKFKLLFTPQYLNLEVFITKSYLITSSNNTANTVATVISAIVPGFKALALKA